MCVCVCVSLTNLIEKFASCFSSSGSVVGRIYNSPTYVDGDVVWTSPITKGYVEANSEVSTESGSRYFLAAPPKEENEEPAPDIISTDEPMKEEPPTKEGSSTSTPPVLDRSVTTAVTPDNLAEVLKGISGAVGEIETLLGLPDVMKSSGKDNKKNQGIDVVLGAQWGDEGKGKLVDMLSQVSESFLFSTFSMCDVCIKRRTLF